MTEQTPAHPPRARMAFRVGVVGHRFNRLPKSKKGLAAIQQQIDLVLDEVDRAIEAFCATVEAKACYLRKAPLLRAVSPLAEGTDRMFAKAALDRGYELCVPMPFARADYVKDFEKTEGSTGEFDAMIDRAERETALTVFELYQARLKGDNAGVPYGHAGRVVVNQSDLLVAIWDGKKGRGKGGTVTTMKEAVGFRVPVLHINATAPYGCSLIERDDEIEACIDTQCTAPALGAEALREVIDNIVRAELALPRTKPKPGKPLRWYQRLSPKKEAREEAAEAKEHARDYFAEKQPRINIGFWWKLYRDIFGDFRLPKPALFVSNFLKHVRKDWPVRSDEPKPEPMPTEMASWVNERLRDHYGWADGLASHYSDAHRSGFLWTSMLAATAVVLALIPVALFGFPVPEADSAVEGGYILAEAAVLFLLFTILLRGRTRRWHERWLEYRMLAEWVRQLRFVIPMGGARPLMRTAAHRAVYGDPKHSWAYWHVRAIARETGIPSAETDATYVRNCLGYLDWVVGDKAHEKVGARGQIDFHTKSERRSHRIHHGLHIVTAILVGATLASVALHWWLATYEPRDLPFCIDAHDAAGWLLIFAAGLPAASAALANIDNQGEFARLSKRSRSMVDAFEHYHDEVGKLTDRCGGPTPPTMVEATLLASQVATTMVEEFIDWRIVAIDLPHEPG